MRRPLCRFCFRKRVETMEDLWQGSPCCSVRLICDACRDEFQRIALGYRTP